MAPIEYDRNAKSCPIWKEKGLEDERDLVVEALLEHDGILSWGMISRKVSESRRSEVLSEICKRSEVERVSETEWEILEKPGWIGGIDDGEYQRGLDKYA